MRRSRRRRAFNKNHVVLYNKYPRYREIQCYLRTLVREFPNRVRLECIGQSIQGRDIDMIVIAKDIRKQRQGCLIDAGIHAREWLANSSALYFVEHVIRNPKINKYMDFYVIPCLNPDGYEYTHTVNRLWRKNMNTNGHTNLKKFGVDLNRNFPFMFGRSPGSSSNPKDFDYRGKYALSEPEAKSLANTFSRYRKLLKLYISLHTYGNLIMFPWAYTKKRIEDRSDLMRCGCACKKAMSQAGRDRHFKVGSIASSMYLSPGCTVDYAKGCHNIKFSFTIELQRGGKSGFTPSPRRIAEIGNETVHGIIAMVKYVCKYYKEKEKCDSTRRRKRVSFARRVSVCDRCT